MPKSRIILFAILVFLPCLAPVCPAGASDSLEPIAMITAVEGACDIAQDNGPAQFINERQPVFVGDRLRTKNYSKLEVAFFDKSVVKLAPNSCITIKEFTLDANQQRRKARIILSRGKLEAVVAKTGSPDTFLINTPNSEGAVKGSDIFVFYQAGQTGAFVKEGALSLRNPALPEAKTLISEGDCSFIQFQETPTAVRSILKAELAQHNQDVTQSLQKKWIPADGAAQMSAAIASMSGEVRIFKKGATDWREAKLNEPISQGDRLQTALGAKAEIRLSNGNALFVQEETELGVASLDYDPNTGDYKTVFGMTQGRVGGLVERISKSSTFQVRTPTAIAGARGSYFEVVAPPSITPITAQACPECFGLPPAPIMPAVPGLPQQPQVTPGQQPGPQTQVFFESGSGYAISASTGQSQDIGAGQNVSVDTAGNVSLPVATPQEQSVAIMQNWISTQTVNAVSGAEGQSGTANTMQQQLPPPPPRPLEGEGPNGPPKPGEMFKHMQMMNNLDFAQNQLPPKLPDDLYVAPQLQHDALHTTANVAGIMNLSLKKDNNWVGDIIGNYATTSSIGSPWNIQLSNGNSDVLRFTMTGPLQANESGIIDIVQLDSAIDDVGRGPAAVDLTLDLDTGIKGTYDGTNAGGTFQVHVTGTWSE